MTRKEWAEKNDALRNTLMYFLCADWGSWDPVAEDAAKKAIEQHEKVGYDMGFTANDLIAARYNKVIHQDHTSNNEIVMLATTRHNPCTYIPRVYKYRNEEEHQQAQRDAAHDLADIFNKIAQWDEVLSK